MKFLSYGRDAATLHLKAVEIRTLRNILAEVPDRPWRDL